MIFMYRVMMPKYLCCSYLVIKYRCVMLHHMHSHANKSEMKPYEKEKNSNENFIIRYVPIKQTNKHINITT